MSKPTTGSARWGVESHESVITGLMCSDEYRAKSARDPRQWLAQVRADLLRQAEAARVSGDKGGLLAGPSTRPEIVSDLVRKSECRQHLVQTIYSHRLALETAARVRPN